MNTSNSYQYWNQAYLLCGPQSLDKLLNEDSTWDDVLAVGEADFALACECCQITTGTDRSALEIGCGAGRMTHALGLRYGHVLGIDISPRMIEEAKYRCELSNVDFAVSDYRSIIRPSAKRFDTIFSYEVLHYVPPDLPDHYFEIAYTLLSPGGDLVFQLNIDPIRPLTKLSLGIRSILYRIGVERWRGWSNDPALQRQYHSPERVTSNLRKLGFLVDPLHGHSRQTWFRAARPEKS